MTIDSPVKTSRRTGLLGWTLRHPKTSLFLIFIMLLVITVFIFQGGANRRLTRRLNAIRARGEPVTVEDLVERIPRIPDDENRAMLLVWPWTQIQSNQIPPEELDKVPYYGRALLPPMGRRLPVDQRQASTAFLAAHAQAVEDLHNALQAKRGVLTMPLKTPMFASMFPNMGAYRQSSGVVALEAIIAAEAADREITHKRISDLFRISSVFNDSPTLITALVQMAILGRTYEVIERILNLNALHGPMLAAIQQELSLCESQPNLRAAILGERVGFHDTMEWLKGKAGGVTPGSFTSSPADYWGYVPILPEMDEVAALDAFAGMLAAIDLPSPDALQSMRQEEARISSLPQYYVISRMMMPSFTRSLELWLRHAANSRALQIGIACERYRLEHGSWPAGLDVLVPNYSRAVPLDPFDGKPLRFAKVPEGVQIWSIGEDMVDNGGDLLKMARQTARKPKSQRASDVGIVVLNPHLRGLTAETDAASNPTSQAGP